MKPKRSTAVVLHRLVRIHPGLGHKITYEFRDGASTKRLSRKHSLPLIVVEQIIRDHVR